MNSNFFNMNLRNVNQWNVSLTKTIMFHALANKFIPLKFDQIIQVSAVY